MTRDEIEATLVAHKTQVTRELLRCACGWYVERGAEASNQHARHVADAIVGGAA